MIRMYTNLFHALRSRARPKGGERALVLMHNLRERQNSTIKMDHILMQYFLKSKLIEDQITEMVDITVHFQGCLVPLA